MLDAISEEELSETADLLYCLDITANYTGFFQTTYAVCFAFHHPESLLQVTKWLYPEVAKYCDTSWKCVEHNIRKISQLAWKHNRVLLEELARQSLPCRPSASVFVSVLVLQLL